MAATAVIRSTSRIASLNTPGGTSARATLSQASAATRRSNHTLLVEHRDARPSSGSTSSMLNPALSRSSGNSLLARHRDRVEVHLQYDGPSKEASIHHRGGDLTRFKDMPMARLSEAGVFTTLTMTAALGVNDGEVGAVVIRTLETPFVGGVSLQPVFGSGRGHGVDPTNRLTHTGVLERLAEQTGGMVSWHDLTALPCSHPHCASVGCMLKDDSGVWRSLTALIGHDQLLAWLELKPDSIANRIADSAIPLELRTLGRTSAPSVTSASAHSPPWRPASCQASNNGCAGSSANGSPASWSSPSWTFPR
ncbi:hypothetical protein [Arthrobacter sp. NPDC057009]|uniref:hypothetical protein n=1 Tax=Arthrobacter sp. NPDC057009 TaxID=3345996 RepID=UPI003631E26E